MISPLTLSAAVREMIEDHFPEYRVQNGNTNTELALQLLMTKLGPLLEAAEGVFTTDAPAAYDDYARARAAIVKGAGT